MFLSYSVVTDKPFLKKLNKLKRNNPQIFDRLFDKMKEIAENPTHHKPLSNVLKGKRRAHVGSFVVIFSIDEKEKAVVFLEFEHHDKAYR